MRTILLLLFCTCFAFSGAALQYGCVIDAGSTGSRIVCLHWEVRSFSQSPLPVSAPIDFFSDRTSEPVATPAGRSALPPLLESARASLAQRGVSAADIRATPLFLKATAGMRVLSEADRINAMIEVRAILSAGPFQFRPDRARTISGEEEGVGGWISVNYMLNLLPGQSQATGTTFGALDLGGASAQITFQPPPGVDILSSQFDVRLTSAAQASLYTHSFLYYGMAEAIRRINELVVLSSALGAGATIQHPCYLAGTPGGVPFTSLIAAGQVNFSGTSNWTACKEFVVPLMLKQAQCLTDPKPTSWPRASSPSGITALDWSALQAQRLPRVAPLPVINPSAPGSSCSIAGQYQPPLFSNISPDKPVRFMAFASFSFAYQALGLRPDGPLTSFRNSSAVFCNMDYATANAAFPASRGLFFMEQCIRTVYAESLLAEGFGLNTTAPGIVTVLPPPPASSVSFASGAMLYEVNGLPFSLQSPQTTDQTPTVIALGVTLGVVVLGSAVFGVCVWRRWPKRKENNLL